MELDDYIMGAPVYLDVVAVNPNPIKGDKGDRGDQGIPGDPGAITPAFIETIATEVTEELEPPINLLLLFDNALA